MSKQPEFRFNRPIKFSQSGGIAVRSFRPGTFIVRKGEQICLVSKAFETVIYSFNGNTILHQALSGDLNNRNYRPREEGPLLYTDYREAEDVVFNFNGNNRIRFDELCLGSILIRYSDNMPFIVMSDRWGSTAWLHNLLTHETPLRAAVDGVKRVGMELKLLCPNEFFAPSEVQISYNGLGLTL